MTETATPDLGARERLVAVRAAVGKAVVGQEKGHLDALAEPDRIVRAKVSTYTTEQQRQREEAERKVREGARLAAEAAQREQDRLRKEAEDKRLAEAQPTPRNRPATCHHATTVSTWPHPKGSHKRAAEARKSRRLLPVG